MRRSRSLGTQRIDRSSSRQANRSAAFLLVLIVGPLAFDTAASAGPPMINDDPHTVGAGHVEVIVAASAGEQADVIALPAPLFDVTIGVLDGLDLAFVASPVFVFEAAMPVERDVSLSLGMKWQPIRGEGFNAAFTPTVALNVATRKEVGIIVPVQIEYAFEDVAIGADLGYGAILNAADQWHAGTYVATETFEGLTLMAELWAFGRTGHSGTWFGMGVGFDWEMVRGWHLLASGGTGIAAIDAERVAWQAYLGVLWRFSAWGAPEKPRKYQGQRPSRPALSDGPDPRLAQSLRPHLRY
jgi:hypothetical protein